MLAGASALTAPSEPLGVDCPTKDITRMLAKYAVAGRFVDIPAPVRKEATRTLLNWVGDEPRIVILLKDGRKVETFIEHAIGSVQNPMSDRDLEVKFAGLTDSVLPLDRSKRVMELCWNAAALKDARALPKAAII